MSRMVDVVVTVDLDLLERTDPLPARCVVGVGDAGWNDDVTPDGARNVERAISLVLDALGQRLADVTGELDDQSGGGVQR